MDAADVRLIFGLTLTLLSPVFVEIIYGRLSKETLEKDTVGVMALKRFHKYSPHLILMSVFVLVIMAESFVDKPLTKALGLDFTRTVFNIEGGFVERLQDAMWNPMLTDYFIFTYTVIYGLLFYSFIIYFIVYDNAKMVRTLVACHAFTYIIAFPFYIFFPVNEIWTTSVLYPDYGLTSVRGVLHAADPGTSAVVLTINSVNNCFPSLHTSVSVTIFLVLLATGYRKLAAIALPFSASVVISTMYLGIHWVTDVMAGIVLSVVVVYIAANLEYEIGHPLKIWNLRWKGKPIRWLSKRRNGS